MQIKYKTNTIFVLFVVFLTLPEIHCANSTTESVTVSTATAATTTTTPRPKVHVADSAICKKCTCDIDTRLLDCSNRNLKNLFSDEEWLILQNGDITFDTINFQHNNLTAIPQIPDYPVQNLYLSFNQIEKIAVMAFQNLSQITKLDLSHNKINSKNLVPDVFKGKYSPSDFMPLDKLIELDLGHNDLHNLDGDLFEHVPKIEILVLCKNIFQVIDQQTETAISGLTSVKTLDMSYMELKALPEYLFHGTRDLETLILTGNLFQKIPQSLVLGVNIKVLNLDENPIGDIEGDNIFPVMPNLRYLSISYMPDLTKIGPNGLSNLQNLTSLYLSNNPRLTSIDISSLRKNTTNSLIFDYPPLEKLYLEHNNLTAIDRKLIERWDKVTVIDLSFNPWICDTTNDWLIHVLIMQINKTNPELTKNALCESPAELKSYALTDPKVGDNLKNSNGTSTGVIFVYILVAFLIGIPVVIGTVVIYRRGCFGLLHLRSVPLGAQYSRASSAEDLHI